MVTGITEVTRNANKASTALRTIGLRLAGMSEDEEKVDGLTAKLEGDFNKLGLTLYDANDELKSTYQILGELSKEYKNMSVAQKAYYTELIAGKTRATEAAAVLEHFDRVMEATETAYNSNGSAARENEKVLDSLNGHIQALRAEWESLVNSKATQDTLKLLVDIGTNIIKIIKNLGGLRTVLIATLATIALIKRESIIKIIHSAISGITMLSHNIQYANSVTIGFKNTVDASTISMLKFEAAVGIVVIAIAGLVQLIKYLSEEHKRNAEAVQKAVENYNDLVNEEEKVKRKIEEINSEISELNQNKIDIIDDDTITKLEAQRKELELQLAVKEKLAAIAKREASDAAKAAILGKGSMKRSELEAAGVDTSGDNRDNIKSGLRFASGFNPLIAFVSLGYQIGESTQNWTSFANEIVSLMDANDKLNVTLNEQKKELEDLESAFVNNQISSNEYNKSKEKLNKSIKENETKLKNNTSALETNMNELLEYKDSLDETDPEAQQLADIIGYLNEKFLVLGENLETFNDVWGKATDEDKDKLKELVNSGSLTIESFEKNLPRLSAYFKKFSQESGKSLSELIDKIQNLIEEEENLDKKSNNTFDETLKKITSSLNKNKEAYSALSSAVKEYQENGKLSTETLVTLIEKYPEYLKILNKEGYSLDVVNSMLRTNTDEMIKNELANIKIAEQENELIIKNQLLGASFKNLKTDIAGYTQSLIDLQTYLQNRSEYEEKKKILEDLLNSNFGSGSGTGAGSSADSLKEAFTAAYNDLKNRRDRDLIDTQTYYSELQKLNDQYFKGRKKYVEEYSKYELEIYKGTQTIFKEQVEYLNHQLTMLENAGASKEELIAKNKEIQDKLHEQAEYYRSLQLEGNQELIDDLSEQWWKYQKNITKLQEEMQKEIKERFQDIRDSAISTIDQQINDLENWLDNENDLLDKRIDNLKEEEDTLEDQKDTEEKLLKIEEARKKLAEAKNKKVRVYREGRGFVYEEDFDAVSSAQSELDALLEEWQLFQDKAKINDIIAELEAEKQANKERVNEQIKDLNRLKEAWNKSLDLADNLEDYNGWLTKIQESESKSYDDRLKALKEFVAAYNAEMKTIQGAQGVSASSGSAGSYEPTKRGSGKNSYYVDVDYQALINNAEAQGAPETHLADLERERNNKIDGEGLPYQKTYKYTTNPNTGSSTPNPQLTGLAKGTTNADGLMHFVGENGPELYIPPKGSGIIPNPNTENLVAWSVFNPMDLVKNLKSVSSDTIIDIDNINLPNVTDANSFIEELKNFKGFAIQRQSVRK